MKERQEEPLARDHGPHHSLTIIFKGTSRCNGGCRFCSVGTASGGTIGLDEFELLGQQVEDLIGHWNVKRLNFTFHGGEPTLLGPEKIDTMCERIRSVADRVTFNMQTNLLHITDEMFDVSRKNKIRLGTSFDPLCGDRRTGNDNDAYPIWRENFLRLSGKGLSPGAIFVVTRRALGKAKRLYKIAEALGAESGHRFGLQVNHVYPQGYAADKSDVLVSPQEFGQFLVDLWHVWNESDRSVNLSPIQKFMANLTGESPTPASCSFSGRCERSHVGIDHDLNVASCGRGLDSRSFLGNLQDKPLTELLEQSEYRQIISRRDKNLHLGECSGCRFFGFCHGGCPDDAMLTTGSHSHKVTLCDGYKMLFETIERHAPRSRVEKGPRGEQEKTEIIAVTDPIATQRVLGAKGRQELWLLPDQEGRAFRFGSHLEPLRGGEGGRLRLWVHNHNVRRLALWEALLRRPRVSVVLFEEAGLTEALMTMNAVGGVVELDVLSLLATGGGAEKLEIALDRFLHERDWKIQLFPFTFMLLNTIERRKARLIGRWGIEPEKVEITVDTEDALEETAATIVDTLLREASLSLREHRDGRRACLECVHLERCGSCLAPGDGGPCSEDARKLVDTVVQAGEELFQIKDQMRGISSSDGTRK